MENSNFLNKEQNQAVEHRNGPLLVIAGAGSGKTRVIEYRVLNLILNRVDPASILLLTFTRKASQEMLSRAAKRDPRSALVEGGTFHAFAVKLLRQHAPSLGISKSFMILDTSDSQEALHRTATKMGFYEGEHRFPQKSTLQKITSAATNKKKPVLQLLEEDYPHFIDEAEKIEALRGEFAKYKLEKSYFDYDDLLIYLKVLLDQEAVRLAVSAQYKYVMVDEYQDTNHLQGEIIALLGKEHHNVMAVGDDAQSIYGFRGAHHQNILNFPKLFPDCKVIKLEANYRSTQEILNMGNQVLDNMVHKFSKTLLSASNRSGDEPDFYTFKEPAQEAAWIADKIVEYCHEGESLNEMAVLFRSSHLSFQVQTELAKRKLPFEMYGGKKFSDMAHVKDILALLKLVISPHDELAWNRILMLLPGVGPKTASKMVEVIQSKGNLIEVHDYFKSFPDNKKFKTDLLFVSAGLVKASEPDTLVISQYATLQTAYGPILENKYDNWHQRAKDLETLSQIAGRYEKIGVLLADFALEPPDRGVFEVKGVDAEEGKISLSTIHSAKGMEWGNVFVIGMIEGVFPTGYALKREETIAEEERLFYVAVTRAKDRLFLSMCHYGFSGGITQFNKVSRFVESMKPAVEENDFATDSYSEGDSYSDDDAYSGGYVHKKPKPTEKVNALTKEELIKRVMGEL